MMPNYHELLVEARNVQARNGLAKSVLVDLNGRTCMRGSIFQAISGRPLWLKATYFDRPATLRDKRAVWERLEGLIIEANEWGDSYCSIPDHNNADATTLDDVLGWFDNAIVATAPPPLDPTRELVEV